MMPSSVSNTHYTVSKSHTSAEPVPNGSNWQDFELTKYSQQHVTEQKPKGTLKQLNNNSISKIVTNTTVTTKSEGYRGKARYLPPLFDPISSDQCVPSADANHHGENSYHSVNEELSNSGTKSNSNSSKFEISACSRNDKTDARSPLVKENTSRVTSTELTTNRNHVIRSESHREHVTTHEAEQHRSLLPTEDIVDYVMPLEGDQSQYKVFDAPPWMKAAVTNNLSSTGRRSSSSPSNNKSSSMAGPSLPISGRGPIVIERRPINPHSPVLGTTSHFRRADSLPSSVIHKRTRVSNPMFAQTDSVTSSGQRIISVHQNAPYSHNLARASGEPESKIPIQNIRQSRHNGEPTIEIARDRIGSTSLSMTTRNMNTSTVTTPNPKPPRAPKMQDSRTHTKSPPGRRLGSESVDTEQMIPTINVIGPSAATGSSTRSEVGRHGGWSEISHSPVLERSSFRTTSQNVRTYRSFRSAHSTPASPTMGQSVNHPIAARSAGLDSEVRSNAASSLPFSSQRMPASHSTRVGETTEVTENLTPIGPPKETVTTRIDPETGRLQTITSRTQSFSDVSKNLIVEKTEQNIEDGQATEYHTTRRIIRKRIPASSTGSQSTNVVESHLVPESAPIERQSIHHQLARSKSTDENVAQWNRQTYSTTDARPYRAASQTNVSSRTPLTRNNWISESNLRTTTTYKQPPMHSTYSAHRENMRKQEEQRRTMEDWQNVSRMHLDESKSAAGTEVLEEMETITLQPIGRGVHDLEPTGSIARSFRANTPTGNLVGSPLIHRPHSSTARIYAPSPDTRRHLRPDIGSNRYYDTYNSRPDSTYAFDGLSSPQLDRVPGRTRLGSTSSDYGAYSARQFSFQRTAERNTSSRYSAQPVRTLPNLASPTVPRAPSSPGFFSRLRSSRSATPNKDLISPTYNNSQASVRSQRYHHASQAFTPGFDQSDGYRTIATTTNVHREMHTSGAPSPYAGTHQNQFYEGSIRGGDSRYKAVSNQTETQWRGVSSTNTGYPGTFVRAGSEFGASGHSDVISADLLQQVKDTSRDWYLPEKTREEVNAILRNKEPGSFVIRNSISYVNSFSIGVKIPQNSPQVQTRPDDIQSGFVRHFIIGTVPMTDGRGEGLQLCGFVNQPIFPSLVAFVHHHILHAGPFPCALRLPTGPIQSTTQIPVQQSRMAYASQASPMSGVVGTTGGTSVGGLSIGSDGIAADMLYLGPVEVDRLDSAAAVRRAITQILSQAASNPTGLPKRCEVVIKAIPHEGVTFTDKTKRTMLRKHIKPTQILWCGMDPENRTFSDPELRARGLPAPRTFGIVARRQHFFMHENVVYVFSELDASQSAFNLIQYINNAFIGH